MIVRECWGVVTGDSQELLGVVTGDGQGVLGSCNR